MKKIIIITAAVLMAINSIAQQDFTLYYMNRTLQSQWLNPSSDYPYVVSVGGLMVPVFGQISPPLHFNYANNAWNYNDIFHMGTGMKADSLVLDLDKMMNNVHKQNNIRFENYFELLSVGFKVKTLFFSFSISEKLNYGISIPGDFMHLIAYGNMPYYEENKSYDFSRLNLSFTHYREYAFGVSASTEKLRIGGRMKLLFGKSNISTDIKTLSLYTNPDNVYMTAVTDMSIHASQPLPIEYEYYADGDSMRFDLPDDLESYFDPANYFLNRKNFGLAVDIGASYEINHQWEVFASATDIGLITWNDNPFSMSSNGNFLFKGIEVGYWHNTDEVQESLENLGDSLLTTFHFEDNNQSYVTFLPSNVYVGGLYKPLDKIHIGALYRAEFYKKSMMSSLTLSFNSNLTKWFSGHVSYSIANNSFINVGLGFTLRLAIFQFYLTTDNVTGIIWPQKSQNMNLRMGCNMVFGYKEKPNSKIFY